MRLPPAAAALRPWLSTPATFAFSALADRTRWHRGLIVACFVASTLLRQALALPSGFAGLAALALAGEVFIAPVCVLADAAVVAACDKVRVQSSSCFDA